MLFLQEPASTDILHFGVLGMHWGVRRYQTKDGMLTPLGKKHLGMSSSKKKVPPKPENYKPSDKPIDLNKLSPQETKKLIDSGRDFVLAHGSELVRSTCTPEEIEKGKKYLSARLADDQQYRYMVSTDHPGKDVYRADYTAKKDLKVAGTRAQIETLQEITGKKSYRPVSEMEDMWYKVFFSDSESTYNYDILNKPISNPKTKQFIDALAKKGYDMVVDMKDVSLNYAQAPVVALNSENSLDRKKVTKW